jgi:D-beta-D-heptose 7-phosphate kinase/D-beta-D-heptose 1-phosphate adenosyltransferase
MSLNLTSPNIVVVGDLMLDKYWSGGTNRTSPEAPVIVVNVKEESFRIGGAGNVALNCQALGANTTILGIIGQDSAGRTLKSELKAKNISHFLQEEATLETITKLRVLSQKQQAIRLDFEQSYQDCAKTLLNEQYKAALEKTDIVILSDYHKGTLSDPQTLIQLAKAQNIPVLVDPKGQDFSRYRGASLIKPNRKEFELIVGPCANQSDLIEKGRALIDSLNIETLLLTLGEEGMLLIEANGEVGHVPSSSKELVDVTGAGDTVIASFAIAKASNKGHLASMHLANLAASIAVSRSGTAAVSLNDLKRAYLKDRTLAPGVASAKAVADAVHALKEQGKKVVFTNGCFDVLHAGHIAYLKKAKALGDKLIVGLNSDASIKRLKGSNRPVSPEESRLEVLASLRFVDWVVLFEEDTPENLLRLIKPSLLVKGGDYSQDDIVGAEIVLADGGEVMPIKHDFLHLSSTQIINRMAEPA